MAFFTGTGEEVYAQRLKRSASVDRLHRTRTRSTSSSITSPPDDRPRVPPPHTTPPSLRNTPAPLPPRKHAASAEGHAAKASIASPSSSLHATRPSTSANIITLGAPHPASTPFPTRATAGSSPRRIHHTPSASDLRGDRERLFQSARDKTAHVDSGQVSHSLDTPSPLATAASRLHTTSLLSSYSDLGQRSPQDTTPTHSAGHMRLFPRSDSRMRPPVSPSTYAAGSGSYSDGNCSDHRSNSPLPSHHLDVKRLLSKPAAPLRGSVYSSASEAEGAPTHWASNPYASSSSHPISTAPWLGFNKEARLAAAADRAHLPAPSRASSADASRARPSTSPLMSSAGYSPTSSSPRSQDGHMHGREKEKEREKDRGERSPRVLRKPRSPGLQLGARTSLAPSSPGTRGSSSPSSTSTATRRPGDARASTLPSPRSPRMADVPDSPRSRLTPAAALAQAYKQQETRRDGLAVEALGGPSPPVSPRSPGHPRRGASESAVPKRGAASPEPYFTVYGSAAGGAFDRAYGAGSPAPGKAPASAPAGGVRRAIVRKVSGRFTRHKSSPSLSAAAVSELPAIPSVKSRSSEAKSRSSENVSRERERSRQSLQERRSMSLPKDRAKSLRLSLDDSFVHVRRSAEAEPGKDEGAAGATPGIKLWRLVKRLSSNGLRDRYQATIPSALPSPPPPVPAIPKELLQTPMHSLLSTNANNTPTKAARPSPRVSTSAATTPDAAPRGRRPPAQKASPSPASATATTPKSRRSVATRSSSPHSDSLFARAPSPRSSASSVVDAPAPLGKQILSPRALRLLDEYSALPALELEPFTLAAEGGGGLPHPPRRARVLSDSPEMPTFSIAGSVNNFAARKTPTTSPVEDKAEPRKDRTMSLDRTRSPPPRPVRSPHRPSAFFPMPEDEPAEAPSPIDLPSVSTLPDTHTSPAPALARSESVSTARPRSPPGASGLTFREMGTFGLRGAMSAREKDALWDELLDRSARAGGTLHLGHEGGGLLSDSLRFSTVSSGSAATTRFL